MSEDMGWATEMAVKMSLEMWTWIHENPMEKCDSENYDRPDGSHTGMQHKECWPGFEELGKHQRTFWTDTFIQNCILCSVWNGDTPAGKCNGCPLASDDSVRDTEGDLVSVDRCFVATPDKGNYHYDAWMDIEERDAYVEDAIERRALNGLFNGVFDPEEYEKWVIGKHKLWLAVNRT